MTGFVFQEDLFATVRRMSWKGAREATGSQNESVIKLLFHFIIIISYYFSQIDDKNSTKMVMDMKNCSQSGGVSNIPIVLLVISKVFLCIIHKIESFLLTR